MTRYGCWIVVVCCKKGPGDVHCFADIGSSASTSYDIGPSCSALTAVSRTHGTGVGRVEEEVLLYRYYQYATSVTTKKLTCRS
nr:hypothetical protein CFP56_55940 [Quercus suber]